jgi:hypothetical protein
LQVLLLLSRLAADLSTLSHLLPVGSSDKVPFHISANDSDIIVATIMALGLLSAQEAQQLQVDYVRQGKATWQACDIG